MELPRSEPGAACLPDGAFRTRVTGLLRSVPKLRASDSWLKRGPIEVYGALPAGRIPMVDAANGQEINWAIEHVPSLPRPRRRHRSAPEAKRCDAPAAGLRNPP